MRTVPRVCVCSEHRLSVKSCDNAMALRAGRQCARAEAAMLSNALAACRRFSLSTHPYIEGRSLELCAMSGLQQAARRGGPARARPSLHCVAAALWNSPQWLRLHAVPAQTQSPSWLSCHACRRGGVVTFRGAGAAFSSLSVASCACTTRARTIVPYPLGRGGGGVVAARCAPSGRSERTLLALVYVAVQLHSSGLHVRPSR